MAGQENQQYTVLYGRLSQEDERAGESNSIQHQKNILHGYFLLKILIKPRTRCPLI